MDLAIIGSEVSLYDTVERVSPDIIAGYDQIHSEKEISENCKDRNLTVRIIRLNTPVQVSRVHRSRMKWGILFMVSNWPRIEDRLGP